MAFIAITECPICKGKEFDPFNQCIDFTTSKEEFSILTCKSCNFLITSPRPDSNSIGKYYDSENYISHSNSSNSLVHHLYKIVRSFTLQWKLKIVQKQKPKGLILDYGCGTGEFLNICTKANWECYGVEPSELARRKATKLTSVPISESFEHLIDKKFDVITLWHVLEHIANLNEILSALKSHLAENGTIIIAVPNYESLDAKIYKSFWAGYDVPRHLWHFSKQNIKRLFTSHGLRNIQTIPMKQDSFYVSLLSERYRNPNTTILVNLIRAVMIGIRSNLAARRDQNYSSLVYIAKP